MTLCRCESCRPDAPGQTWTRAWALECEARLVLRWPKEQRRPYLDKIEKQRGLDARQALECEIRRLWRTR